MDFDSTQVRAARLDTDSADTHMVFGAVRLTDRQAERLCWGLGSFRNPAAPLSNVLHHIGYYSRPTKVVNRMDAYRPQKIDPHRWARIRAFVEDSVATTAPHTVGATRTLLQTVAHYVQWAVFVQQLPLDGNVIWAKPTIDRYVTSEFVHLAEGTRRNYRSYLDRVRAAVRPQENDYQYTPQNRKSSVAPYTAAEIEQYREWAVFQTTSLKKDRAMMLMVFCTGAGLRVSELAAVTHAHITRTTAGYQIEVIRGSFPRLVPLLAEWDDWLDVILERRPVGPALWGSANRTDGKNLVSSFTQYTEGKHPRSDRLRNTWIVAHLTNRVPIADLFYAAGVRKMEHLGRLIQHIPPLDAVDYQAIFRGEVTR